LLPDLDVLLPSVSSSAERERYFVAAFRDEKAVSLLADRIQQHFERLPHLKQASLTVSVSYSMLHPVSPDVGASREDIVASMAKRLDEAINSHVIPETVSS
jgi:hypothetical protein